MKTLCCIENNECKLTLNSINYCVFYKSKILWQVEKVKSVLFDFYILFEKDVNIIYTTKNDKQKFGKTYSHKINIWFVYYILHN